MRDGKATKERITQTALRLFVDKGIAATTIRDIAAAAGVAEGTMYRHFDSKDEMAWQLFHQNYSAFVSELNSLRQTEPTLRSQIHAIVRRTCQFFDADPVLFSYLLLAQHGHLRRLPPDSPNPLDVLRDAIEAGMASGEIPHGDALFTASMVMGLVLQVAVSKVYGRFAFPLSDAADALSAAAWRVLSDLRHTPASSDGVSQEATGPTGVGTS